ncbi:MAG TPA: hypothetical protein VGC42_16815 [Kofleriaceae bacterium]
MGWATFNTTGKMIGKMAPPSLTSDVGGTASIAYERQLSTDLGIRAELAGGMFYGGDQPMEKQSKTSYAALGDAGLVFRFDVLKYVPYAFAGVGGVVSGGGPIDNGADFVLVVGGGVDWLVSRETSFGVEARVASFGGDVTFISVGVRGTWRWGFL